VILWKLERGKRTVRRMCDPMEALKGGSERPGCVYPMEALKGTLKKKKKKGRSERPGCVYPMEALKGGNEIKTDTGRTMAVGPSPRPNLCST
jgi:hypothetical protein